MYRLVGFMQGGGWSHHGVLVGNDFGPLVLVTPHDSAGQSRRHVCSSQEHQATAVRVDYSAAGPRFVEAIAMCVAYAHMPWVTYLRSLVAAVAMGRSHRGVVHRAQ